MRRMVCDSCWDLWDEPREQKTMGSFGHCCVCLKAALLSGPIGFNEKSWLCAKLVGLDPGKKPDLHT